MAKDQSPTVGQLATLKLVAENGRQTKGYYAQANSPYGMAGYCHVTRMIERGWLVAIPYQGYQIVEITAAGLAILGGEIC
jgi:hypothetical protein